MRYCSLKYLKIINFFISWSRNLRFFTLLEDYLHLLTYFDDEENKRYFENYEVDFGKTQTANVETIVENIANLDLLQAAKEEHNVSEKTEKSVICQKENFCPIMFWRKMISQNMTFMSSLWKN